MPYYPQSPGFYPPLNSVTDGQLVDMPDGTVKGRALGAGLGDPQNLTAQQLAAIHGLGYPMVRHDCRFDYVNASTCRLVRYGGALITIDAQLRTIPAAGVDLAYNAGWSPAGVVLYIYATWNGSAIVLVTSTSFAAVDARDGNLVEPTHADWTLVGMIGAGYGSFLMGGPYLLVASYWNRLLKAAAAAFNGFSTSAASGVVLTDGQVLVLTWGD